MLRDEDLNLREKQPELSIEDKHASLEYLAMTADDMGIWPADLVYAGLESKYKYDFQELLSEYALSNGEYLIEESSEDFIVKIFNRFGDENAYDFFQQIGIFSNR